MDKRIGILLTQLGTPDAADPKAVRRYLKEFLSDRRVVDVSRFIWIPLLYGIILNTRPKKSAQLYQRLFQTYGPVLRTYCASLVSKLATKQSEYFWAYGMSYGNPSIDSALQKLIDEKKCTYLLVVPLYPQYCDATTGTTLDVVTKSLLKRRFVPALRVMPPFAAHPLYLDSLAELLRQALAKRSSSPERIVLSYHGIPKRYVTLGDPYEKFCLETTDGLRSRLNFAPDHVLHVYQSRFGKEPWLQPYCAETLVELAQAGIKDVMIACPSFTIDCLETLDEIAVENKKLFYENGGERLELVSCLNDHPLWVESLNKLIQAELMGW